jgi:hypothetical protein
MKPVVKKKFLDQCMGRFWSFNHIV